MKLIGKLAVDNVSYEKIKQLQIKNGNDIKEHIVGIRKSLYVKNTLVATIEIDYSLSFGKISNNQFVSFLGRFNKNLYDRFISNPGLYEIDIKFNGVSRNKNIEVWEKLPVNAYFYNIDLKSAYWQIAHKLGYISDKMFNTYMDLDDYKQAKRLCVSFLSRPNKMNYQFKKNNGVIECDTKVLRKVYENIRNELYSCIKQCIKTKDCYLEYNIDGITILKEHINQTRLKLKELNLKYKITECRKINETDYTYGSKMRKFINKKL